MKHSVTTFLLSFFLLAGLLTACDDEKFSTSPTDTLSFSTDTIRMDTVLTGMGTPTYILKVYNTHEDALNISSITLANAANSGFRINVDGSKGTTFNDIEIRGKDSLSIFVEATFAKGNNDQPSFKKDSIVFITNGTRQNVKILAFSQDFISLKGKVITHDTLLASQRPIVVYDSLIIAKGAQLTIGAGTRFLFHDKAGMRVDGKIISQGTLTQPVRFRGDRSDYMFSYLTYDELPGQWGGITIGAESYDNIFDYTDIHGGNYGIRCDSSTTDHTKLTFTNSSIRQVSGNGLEMTDCKAVIGNSEFSNTGGYCVSLTGGHYEFVHCTLANYFSWNVKTGVALFMSNKVGNNTYPLTLVSFRNCLIAGSSSDEISGSKASNSDIPYNYYFSHCLINSTEETNDQIVEVLWKKDDHFAVLNTAKQKFDFRLDSLSAAINIGLKEDAQAYPYDLKGVSRLDDTAPDAGCYEWKPKNH